jgi:methylthioribulose-1-phosphate dehydratase
MHPGNLSARLPDDSFWITASGRSKGNLTADDFVRLTVDGDVLERSHDAVRPSAETVIHQTLYTLFPNSQACYHIHSIEANLVSRFVNASFLSLPPLEMIKGFGVWQEKPSCVIPIFENHLQVDQIANEIQQYFQVNLPQISVLLIRDHGVTVWANSTETARNFIELIEYIFRYMVAARQINLS